MSVAICCQTWEFDVPWTEVYVWAIGDEDLSTLPGLALKELKQGGLDFP